MEAKLLGLFAVAYGVVYIIKPEIVRGFDQFLFRRENPHSRGFEIFLSIVMLLMGMALLFIRGPVRS